MAPDSNIIPARSGAFAKLTKGQKIKIINTHGKQVIDTWAFTQTSPLSYMSMSHTRASLLKLIPSVGDTLVSNTRQPMLTIIEDTTPGVHDTLFAACDKYRYQQLGVAGYHDSCTDNLHKAAKNAGLDIGEQTPDPLNLFMNIPVDMGQKGGKMGTEPPVSEKGQYVSFQAECDLVVVMSACPQDLVPVNDMKPTEAAFEVY